MKVSYILENPGQEEKFKRLQKINEVLSNDEKRKLYDRGGEEAVERGILKHNSKPLKLRGML
jgi:DnaJ-class molecular chaperone